MKKDNGDKLVREKMGSLDSLSGGIVFGKEEAWEKLQARMDHKPAKKIALRYWLAAAAVLLLFVTIIAVYFYPAKQETTIAVKEKVKAPVNNVTVSQPVIAPVLTQPEKPAEHAIAQSFAKELKQRKTLIKKDETITQPAITAVQNTPAPINEIKKEEVAVNNAAPVTPKVVPMKVVHINDIENGSAGKYNTAVSNTSIPVVINKLPVVYINDVEREAVEVKKILHENRMTFGHFPFYKQADIYEDDNLNTDEPRQPLNFLKRKINTQN